MKIYKKQKWAGILLVCLLLFSIGYYFFDAALFSVMGPLANNKAETAATAAIENAVYASSVLKKSDSLIDIQRNADGKILSMSTDAKELAAFRSDLADALTEKMEDFHVKLQIPLGSVIGGGIFTGRGIPLSLYVTGTGGLHVDTESAFLSAGLNQTCHQVYVNVSADLTLLYHGQTKTVTVTTKVLASETVIVGEVPAAYFGTYKEAAD